MGSGWWMDGLGLVGWDWVVYDMVEVVGMIGCYVVMISCIFINIGGSFIYRGRIDLSVFCLEESYYPQMESSVLLNLNVNVY